MQDVKGAVRDVDGVVCAHGSFPSAVDRGSFRFFSGLTAAAAVGSGDSWIELAEGPWRREAEAIYARLAELEADAGGISSVLRLHLYQKDKRFFPVLESVRVVAEGATPAPSSGIGIATLASSDSVHYEADGIGLSSAGHATFGNRAAIERGKAGASASHYSQVSLVGPYAFLAGFIPIDPDTHALVAGFDDVEPAGRFLQRGRSHPDARTGPIAAQTWALYQRILDSLGQLEIGVDGIVNATIFLARAGDAADFLRVHNHLFGTAGPALQLVCVDEVGHKGCLIEIEVTAVSGIVPQRQASTTAAADPSTVVVAGELAFLSDRLGTHDGGFANRISDIEDENARRALQDIAGDDHPEEAVIAQTWTALTSLARDCATAGIPLSSIGHLWIRVRRPSSSTWVEPLLRAFQPSECAVTVSEVHSIPQSEAALASVSAVCGGLEMSS